MSKLFCHLSLYISLNLSASIKAAAPVKTAPKANAIAPAYKYKLAPPVGIANTTAIIASKAVPIAVQKETLVLLNADTPLPKIWLEYLKGVI